MTKLIIASAIAAVTLAGCAPYVESQANCFKQTSFVPNEDCKYVLVGS
jgi:hypothetical protein